MLKVSHNGNYLIGRTLSGKVCWRIQALFVHAVVHSSRFVVFSDHNRVIGLWSPAEGGASTLNFLRGNWIVYGHDMNTGRLLWEQSVVAVGDPVALTAENELWTIHLVRPETYYLEGQPPTFALQLHDARTGQLRRAWRLPPLELLNGKWRLARRGQRTQVDKATERHYDYRWYVTIAQREDSGSLLKMTLKDQRHPFRLSERSVACTVFYYRNSGKAQIVINNQRLSLQLSQ